MTDRAVTAEGQKAFRRIAFNVLSGRCTCGRLKNRQGRVCCRMCRERYAGHSKLCRKNNGDAS